MTVAIQWLVGRLSDAFGVKVALYMITGITMSLGWKTKWIRWKMLSSKLYKCRVLTVERERQLTMTVSYEALNDTASALQDSS
jgi:hypothetical protein